MRTIPTALLAAAGLLTGTMADVAAAAPRVECHGTVTIVSQSNVQITQRGRRTLTEFDYTARQTLCLPDGDVVDDAQQVGHLTLRQRMDGSGTVSFVSTVTYGDGSLNGIGHGRIGDDGVITGRVVVPSGTGSFAGTTGHGRFRSTGPTTFEDVVWYRFG